MNTSKALLLAALLGINYNAMASTFSKLEVSRCHGVNTDGEFLFLFEIHKRAGAGAMPEDPKIKYCGDGIATGHSSKWAILSLSERFGNSEVYSNWCTRITFSEGTNEIEIYNRGRFYEYTEFECYHSWSE